VVFNHNENVEGNCTDLILYILCATILHIYIIYNTIYSYL